MKDYAAFRKGVVEVLMNLKAEIVRAGISSKAISQAIGISISAMSRKTCELVDFTRSEMYEIQNRFFRDKTIDYLFQSDKTTVIYLHATHSQAAYGSTSEITSQF